MSKVQASLILWHLYDTSAPSLSVSHVKRHYRTPFRPFVQSELQISSAPVNITASDATWSNSRRAALSPARLNQFRSTKTRLRCRVLQQGSRPTRGDAEVSRVVVLPMKRRGTQKSLSQPDMSSGGRSTSSG